MTTSYSLGSATGTWSFASDKEEIVITFVTGGSFFQVASTMTYTILRLKEKELWVKYTDAFGNVIEEHYKEA